MFSDELRSSITGNLGHTPTPGQQSVIHALVNYLFDRSDRIFLIKGYAGTGKTSMVASLVKSLTQYHYRSVLLAPTGRAAKVLSRYSGAPAFTIHKKIYRQNSVVDGFGEFSLDRNMSTKPP
jgi:exodeoxyribonuclease-5